MMYAYVLHSLVMWSHIEQGRPVRREQCLMDGMGNVSEKESEAEDAE